MVTARSDSIAREGRLPLRRPRRERDKGGKDGPRAERHSNEFANLAMAADDDVAAAGALRIPGHNPAAISSLTFSLASRR